MHCRFACLRASGAGAKRTNTDAPTCREVNPNDPDAALGEYDVNPDYPNLAQFVPLTFALTMHACLREHHRERPTFEQIIELLDDVHREVASGEYIDVSGAKRVRRPRRRPCAGQALFRACPVT